MEHSNPIQLLIITTDQRIVEQITQPNAVTSVMKLAHGTTLNHQISSSKSLGNQSLICVVCGVVATGYNFGAIACESCKAFFRRSCRKDAMKVQCSKTNTCEITIDTRRGCPACRLQKCFQYGMQRERLGKYKQKQAKHHQGRSDAPTSVPHSNSDEQSNQVGSSVVDFLDLLPPSLLQFSNTLLNSEESQHIQNIEASHGQRFELALTDGLPWDPAVHATTFLETLNSESVAVMRLLAFLKQIPAFQQLNVDDKVLLIKYNLMAAVAVNCALVYNTETNQILETESDSPWNIQFFQILHGYHLSNQVQKIFASLLKIAKYDPHIIRLTLVQMMFTKRWVFNTSQPNLADDAAIHRAQNYYTELLWKYMETKYRSDEAAQIFSQLVINILSYQTVEEELRNNIKRVLSPEDVNALVPIMRSALRIC